MHHLGQIFWHVWQRVEAGANGAGRHRQTKEMLLDAIVQFARQPVPLLDHGQRAHLVGEPHIALPQFTQVLLAPFEVFGHQVQLLGQQTQVVGDGVRDAQ